MAKSSLITTTAYRSRVNRLLKELIDIFDTASGHDHDGTNSKSVSASTTYGTAGQMATPGIAAANAAGSTAASARIDHVHIAKVNDDVSFLFGTGSDVSMLWSTGDASNHAFVVGLGASNAVHIAAGADKTTDWNLPADNDPTLYIHRATTNPATEYMRMYVDGTDAHIDAVGNNLSLDIAGSGVFAVTAAGADVTGALTASTTLEVTGTSTFTGAVTTVAGVTVGGTLDVTGAVTTTTHLTVGGNLTVTGSWVINSTFDLNGNELVMDVAGNDSLHVSTDNQLDMKLNGNDEYVFTVTHLDMNSNHLDNTGYVVLNAVTLPAGTEVYVGQDNTGDFNANALTGKVINLQIAGIDEVVVSGAALYPATDDGQTLGIKDTNDWSDVFIATGGTINWENDNVILTHSTGALTITGSFYANDAAGPAVMDEAATTTNPTLIPNKAEVDTGIGWASDTIHIVLGGADEYSFSATTLDMNANTITEAGTITTNEAAGPAIANEAATSTNPTLIPDQAEMDTGIGWASDTLHFVLGGANEVQVTTSAMSPGTNDGNALGTTSLGWSDLHLATGGVINWANGNATITHSTNTLSFDATATGEIVMNDAGADVNFRVETALGADTFSIDGATGHVGIGGTAPVADVGLVVEFPAQTATANAEVYRMHVKNSYAITIPTGTAANVATVRFDEPNITATGTVTSAYTVFISGAPTEGAANYALYVAGHTLVDSTFTAAGLITSTASITFASGAQDLIVKADTAAALEVSDGTTKLMAFDSRNTTTATTHIAITNPTGQTLPDGAGVYHRNMGLAAYTTTLLGTTPVTTHQDGLQLFLGAPTIAQSGGAVTVDRASTLYVETPVAGGSVTITTIAPIDTETGGYLSSAGAWTDASSVALKKDIRNMDYKLFESVIDQVTPRLYKYGHPGDGGYIRFGLIAEEVPEELAQPGRTGIAARDVAGLAITGVKWLKNRMEELETELAAVKRLIAQT